MSEAIQVTTMLLRRPQCNNCGETEGTLVFELNVNPVGNSRQVMTWCPVCAREVIAELSSAFGVAPSEPEASGLRGEI